MNRRFVLLALAAVTVLALVGCTQPATQPETPAATTQDPAALVGDWELKSSTDAAVDMGTMGIFASFTATEVSGFSGVNQYGGTYTAKDDGSIEFGQMRSTLMAGPEDAMKAEQSFLKSLDEADRYMVDGKMLTLYKGEQPLLVFQKGESAALPGTSWIVTNYNNGKEAVVGMSADATVTLEFATDKTLSGNAGVNSYNGMYDVRGETITIGEIASTMMAGPDELMQQEQLYLAALAKANTWQVRGDQLELRDANGALQVGAMAAK